MAVIGAVAALAALALAVARCDLAVGLGFVLLGIARVEPSPSDVLFAGAIAVTLVGGRLDLRRVPGPILALLAMLLALSVLSAIDAVALGEALRFLLITAYLVVFAVWLAMWVDTPARMRLVTRSYVLGAAACAAAAVAALLAAWPGHEALVRDGVRAEGLFKDPNVFGPFLVPAALILLEEALRPRLLGIRRGATTVLFFVLALGVALSYSRAAWLNATVALAVMLLVLALRRGNARRATAAVAVVLAGVALAGTVIVVSGSTDLVRERARAQPYDAERFEAQREGVLLAERHPLGIGPGQVEAEGAVSSHSIYVRVLAEQGVPGLLALVGLLGGTLLLAVANALAGRHAMGVGSAALLAAWCGLLANSAFVDTLHWRHLWLVAALVWIAAAGGGGRRPSSTT